LAQEHSNLKQQAAAMEASVAQHKNATEQAARSQTAEAEAEKQRLSA